MGITRQSPQARCRHASHEGDDSIFRRLDDAKSLTVNQYKIVAAAIIGDMPEFFDYFLIAFVLAFIIKPWQHSFPIPSAGAARS